MPSAPSSSSSSRAARALHELYALRSVAAALAERPREKKNHAARAAAADAATDGGAALGRYEAAFAALRPTIEQIAALADLRDALGAQFKLTFEIAAAALQSRGPLARLYAEKLVALVDAAALLDCVKDAKPCLQNDFAVYKRAFHMVKASLDPARVSALTREQDNLQAFLADPKCPRASFFQAFLEGIANVRHAQTTLVETLQWAARRLRARDYFMPEERWRLARAIPHLILALDQTSDDRGAEVNVFKTKKLLNADVVAVLRAFPVLRAHADMQYSTVDILSRCPHFDPVAHAGVFCTSVQDSPDLLAASALRLRWPCIAAQHRKIAADLHLLAERVRGVGPAARSGSSGIIDCNLALDVHASVLAALSHLASWQEAITDEAALKLASPADDAALAKCGLGPDHPAAPFAKALCANYSTADCAALADCVSMLKSLGQFLLVHEHLFAPYMRAAVYERAQSVTSLGEHSLAVSLDAKRRKVLKELLPRLQNILRDERRERALNAAAAAAAAAAAEAAAAGRKRRTLFRTARKPRAEAAAQSLESDNAEAAPEARVRAVTPSETQLALAYHLVSSSLPCGLADECKAAKGSFGIFASPTQAGSASGSSSTPSDAGDAGTAAKEANRRGSKAHRGSGSQQLEPFLSADAQDLQQESWGPALGRPRLASSQPESLVAVFDALRTASQVCSLEDTVLALTDLGTLWHREFYLDLSRAKGFPVATSLPFALLKSALTNPQAMGQGATLYVLDLYNDAANWALRAYRQQYLFDEIEAEASLAVEAVIETTARSMYTYHKSLCAENGVGREDPHRGGPRVIDAFRLEDICNQTNLHLLGRHLNLAQCLAARAEEVLRNDLATAVENFEAAPFAGIAALDVEVAEIQRTRSALEKAMRAESLSQIAQILLAPDASPQSESCLLDRVEAHASRALRGFVASAVYDVAADRFLPPSFQDDSCGGANGAGVIGVSHFVSFIRVLGRERANNLVIRLVEDLAQALRDHASPLAARAAEVLDPQYNFPSLRAPLEECMASFSARTDAILGERCIETLEVFRKAGNGLAVAHVLQLALDRVEIDAFAQVAPYHGINAKRDLVACQSRFMQRTTVFGAALRRFQTVLAGVDAGTSELASAVLYALTKMSAQNGTEAISRLDSLGDGPIWTAFVLVYFAGASNVFAIRNFCSHVLRVHHLRLVDDAEGKFVDTPLQDASVAAQLHRAQYLEMRCASLEAALKTSAPIRCTKATMYHPPARSPPRDLRPTMEFRDAALELASSNPNKEIAKPKHLRRSVDLRADATQMKV